MEVRLFDMEPISLSIVGVDDFLQDGDMTSNLTLVEGYMMIESSGDMKRYGMQSNMGSSVDAMSMMIVNRDDDGSKLLGYEITNEYLDPLTSYPAVPYKAPSSCLVSENEFRCEISVEAAKNLEVHSACVYAELMVENISNSSSFMFISYSDSNSSLHTTDYFGRAMMWTSDGRYTFCVPEGEYLGYMEGSDDAKMNLTIGRKVESWMIGSGHFNFTVDAPATYESKSLVFDESLMYGSEGRPGCVNATLRMDNFTNSSSFMFISPLDSNATHNTTDYFGGDMVWTSDGVHDFCIPEGEYLGYVEGTQYTEMELVVGKKVESAMVGSGDFKFTVAGTESTYDITELFAVDSYLSDDDIAFTVLDVEGGATPFGFCGNEVASECSFETMIFNGPGKFTVRVSGRDDFEDDGEKEFALKLMPAVLCRLTYCKITQNGHELSMNNITIDGVNLDDDTAGVVVSQGLDRFTHTTVKSSGYDMTDETLVSSVVELPDARTSEDGSMSVVFGVHL